MKLKLKKPNFKKINLKDINFKKYKVNKEKLRKRLPLAIGIILLIIALAVFPNTLSRYSSSGVSGTNINVAYSLLDVVQNDNGTIVESVKLPEVNPGDNSNEYVIEIRNWKDVVEDGVSKTKIINVKMRYYLELVVTTNLPMTYSLRIRTDDKTNYNYGTVEPYSMAKPTSCSDASGDAIIEQGLYCDSHNTYYYKFVFPSGDNSDPANLRTLTYGKKMHDTVYLSYSLPASANTSNFQDIIELLSIKVHAEQYVKNK